MTLYLLFVRCDSKVARKCPGCYTVIAMFKETNININFQKKGNHNFLEHRNKLVVGAIDF